ncbi:N-acetyllactosaminide beta-1,3-N-acetylglucosaminyltransferase 2-like [Pecten maximus]|uniref:N-acetyllactosaminide beta-1,3-N-acetylglucosaminyltransferase 2-like n=1 Tax=Pecten maximus TaxID=6579 RepID=UPI0014585B8B|nr:N-acetyllactosaminide beta-1,3-N-acetylglucosaminyltransferase 2-like [Pecten maximus]XP_033742497.1 N-acetyllactosaminide beta-1,3-N-acetylglucosaminyltransferase 2-like [Pecten maximus]
MDTKRSTNRLRRILLALILTTVAIFAFTIHFRFLNGPLDSIDFNDVSREASYQSVLQHSDGSLDVIFNVPASSNLARKLRQTKVSTKKALYNLNGIYKKGPLLNKTTDGAVARPSIKANSTGRRFVKKTLYPVTLQSPYLINNVNICKDMKKPGLLVIVHTATDHFKRRRSIRETWANKNILINHGLRIVFMFGLTDNKDTEIMLENESVVHGDIVQGNFKDTYHNLTHKGVLAYRWITEYCPKADLIVKVDDDMFVNIFLLLDVYFPKYKDNTRFMGCQVRHKGTSPIVRNKSKWQVKGDEFKNMTHYPVTYCNGYFVIMSPSIIRELYRASFMTPFFWVDDVYLYGLLPYKIGKVKHIPFTSNLTLSQEAGIKCFTGNTTCHYLAAYAFKEGVMEKLWYASLSMFKDLAVKYLPKELLLT